MKSEVPDDVLIQYVLGRMDQKEVEILEQQIRVDRELRDRVFELQASIEERVSDLEVPANFKQSDFDAIKVRSQMKVGIIEEPMKQEMGSSTTPSNLSNKQISWIRYFGAMAAMIVFALVSVGLVQFMETNRDALDGPSLVVYDIVDGASIDVEKMKSGENIREVLYINDKSFDRLSRAEAYAEQLWQEYLTAKAESPESINTSGFVVLDLKEEQGFAGFYDTSEERTTARQSLNTLWLADHSVEKPVSVNPVKPESGVFYFRLKKGEVELSTLNQFVPISKPSAQSGI